MRLFIGVPLSPSVTDLLAALRAKLERAADGLRWSSPESWHITLQFLGPTPDAQYNCVVGQLHTLHAAPHAIQVEGLGFFDRTGIFFAGVAVSPGLVSLQQRVVAATTVCGFKAEDRPYHPHITLARAKGHSDGIRSLKNRIGRAPRFPGFTAREFLLYESFTGPSGSRYEVRARFPLQAS